ncbi:MAG TPA: ABC transporter substrate-binding protein [Nitrososphaerales archaeon]|nr:ABC transporter substrate-binding protein [Nitrososphaerales archaeon]
MAITDWVKHNANFTQWIFNVRPGLKWSDGTNVTSQDILYTFGPNYFFNPNYDFLGMGSEVAKEFAINSSAAEYDLNVSDGTFALKIGGAGIPVVPQEVFAKNGPDYLNFGTNVVVGPFYASNYSASNTQMVMLPNPYYSLGSKPAISQIDVNFVETLSTMATYVESGAVDLAQINPSDAPAVLKFPNIHLLQERGNGITMLEFNDSIYPYNMTQFRQALAYAINDSDIVNSAFAGYAETGYNGQGVVDPMNGTNYWYNPNVQKYSFDQNKSLSLLASIGIMKGSDGLLHYKNGTAVSITLWADTDQTEDTVAAGIMQNNLESMGFTVPLQITSLDNMIGYYQGNVQGIQSGIILRTFYGNDNSYNYYFDSLPGWDTYWDITTPSQHWLWPPSADAEYQSNTTALYATGNTTQDKQYLFNIESLQSQYLPTVVIAYPSVVYAYSTAHWTNWLHDGSYFWSGGTFNATALTSLQPLGQSSGSSTSTSSQQQQSSSSPSSSSVSSQFTSQAGSQTSSATTPAIVTTTITAPGGGSSGGLSTVTILAIAVVVIITLGAGGYYLARSRRGNRA